MPTPSPLQTTEPNEAQLTAAVQRCCEAYHHELAIPRPKESTVDSHALARQAYRNAMPFLTSPDNIDAFIACVAHGMLLGAIYFDDGSKLLYAAQVAIGSRRARLQAIRQTPQPKTTTTPYPLPEPEKKTPTPYPSTAGAPGPLHSGTWDVTITPPPSPITQSPNPATKKPVTSEVSDPTGLIHHTEQCLARSLDSRGLSS